MESEPKKKRGPKFTGKKRDDVLDCECGVTYQRGNKVHHKKSKHHTIYIQKYNELIEQILKI